MSIHKQTDEPNVLRIYGASDDLIEVEGAVCAEFNPDAGESGEDELTYLATSAGTLLSIDYTKGGIWRVHVLDKGDAIEVVKEEAPTDDEDNYSDVVTLRFSLPVKWVLCCGELVRVGAA
jgi:hypothetical protein